MDNTNLDQPEKSEVAHFLWQYFAVTNNTDARKGGAKNAVCMFCDKSFSGCSTSRAAAHILGRPVLAQEKAGIRPCIAIYKKDDDRRSALRTAQKTIGEMMRGKEQSMDGKKRKQQVMDELLVSPSKQSVESSVIVSKSGSKEVDTKTASFFYENGISFNVADSSSFACMIEESIKYAERNPLQSYTVSSHFSVFV